jgi:hypothetical protein
MKLVAAVERIWQGVVALTLVGMFLGILYSVYASALPRIKAFLGITDDRGITVTVSQDDLIFSQESRDPPLKDCTLTLNDSFSMHTASLGSSELLPLREFSRSDGERMSVSRYKVRKLRLKCDHFSRSVTFD